MAGKSTRKLEENGMKSTKVTDPALLAQLNADEEKVSDPELLKQLNSEEENEDEGAYLDNLPEPEGFLKKLPRNIAAGLGQMQRKIFNTPHDLAQMAEGAIKNIGRPFMSKEQQQMLDEIPFNPVSENIPHQSEKDFAKFFGQEGEGTLMDKILQKGIEHAPDIASIGKLGHEVLKKAPIINRYATRQLKKGRKEAIKENVNLPSVSWESLQQSVPFLPNTHATREMLEKARNGNFDAIFSLQSQVGKHARTLAKSPLPADRLLSSQARELKQTLMHEMETGLREKGYGEIADLMKGGINDYRKYMKFREKAMPIFKKLKWPTSGLAVLGLGTDKGRKTIKKLFE